MSIVSIALKLGISTREIKKMKLLTTIAATILAFSIASPVKARETLPQVPSPNVNSLEHALNLSNKENPATFLGGLMAKYKRAEIRCLISADITASSLYFHERYQSELVMSYARIFRKEFCQWGDAAYFASVDNRGWLSG
jgi:hypothetical protein